MNDKAMMILTHIDKWTHIDGLNDIPDTYPVNSFVCKIPCTGDFIFLTKGCVYWQTRYWLQFTSESLFVCICDN